MKKLVLILFSIFHLAFFNEAKSQLSFQASRMTTELIFSIDLSDRKTEDIDAMVTVNSDTTEIEVKFKNARIKEKIGKLYRRAENGEILSLFYALDKLEKLTLHFDNNILFLVVFHNDLRKLTFE